MIVVHCTVELRCHDHLLISFLPLIAFLLLVSFSSSFLLSSVLPPNPSCLPALSVMSCWDEIVTVDKTNKEASSEIAEAQLQTGEAILITASYVFYLTWIVCQVAFLLPLFHCSCLSWLLPRLPLLALHLLYTLHTVYTPQASFAGLWVTSSIRCWSSRAVVRPRRRLTPGSPCSRILHVKVADVAWDCGRDSLEHLIPS